MMNKKIIKVGIIGGLGPLASASFVETVYKMYLSEDCLKEQYHSPYVYLYSEPLLSQTTSIMSVHQSQLELLEKMEQNVVKLINNDIDHIIICCFTAHALLPKLESSFQNKIRSLVTPILEHLLKQKKQCILLSASSAREASVFEQHELWPRVARQITFVDRDEQNQLNAFIQTVKNSCINTEILDEFLEFINRYSSLQCIIACAELHVLHKELQRYCKQPIKNIFDPFYQITRKLWGKLK